jgi:hypothetical protein
MITTIPSQRSWIRRRTGALLVVCLAPILTGCGYSSEPLYRSSIRSVYVEMFQSKEFRRGIEFELTEALRKEIDRTTPYRNAPREKADTVLTGEILEWREQTLGRDFVTDLPRETAATLAIRYTWKDLRTGKLLVDQPRFIATISYVRPAGETAYNAREDATTKAARLIVQSMESPW